MNPPSIPTCNEALENHYRDLWSQFNEDTSHTVIHKFRTETGPELKVLKDEFEEFVMAHRELTIESTDRLRANLLRRLQIQFPMDVLLESLPPKYHVMQVRIKNEYDTAQDLHYIQQVNRWLHLIAESTSDALGGN